MLYMICGGRDLLMSEYEYVLFYSRLILPTFTNFASKIDLDMPCSILKSTIDLQGQQKHLLVGGLSHDHHRKNPTAQTVSTVRKLTLPFFTLSFFLLSLSLSLSLSQFFHQALPLDPNLEVPDSRKSNLETRSQGVPHL